MIKIERQHMYFVWTKKGHVPRRMHSTHASACTEAKRLAELCPGKKFIVLHGTHKFSVAPEAESPAADLLNAVEAEPVEVAA